MPSLVQIQEQRNQLIAQAREAHEKIASDTNEARRAELMAEYSGYMEQADSLNEQIEREIELAATERRHVFPDQTVEQQVAPEPTAEQREQAYRDAFWKWVRGDGAGGPPSFSPEERQILVSRRIERRADGTIDPTHGLTPTAGASAGQGGYLLPQTLARRIIETLKMWGPMYDPGITSELVTNDGNKHYIPTIDDTAETGETTAVNERISSRQLTFGRKELDAFPRNSKMLLIPWSMLQDVPVNLEQFVAMLASKNLGRGVNDWLTNGTGSAQPQGISKGLQGVAGRVVTTAAAIGGPPAWFDELINLQHRVDPAYRAMETRWMFNDDTLKILRQVKDNDDKYIWQPANVQSGAPASLLGDPYSINQAMDSAASEKFPVIYGALRYGYVVRKVRAMDAYVLRERFAERLQTGFFTWLRVDGAILDESALAILKIKKT